MAELRAAESNARHSGKRSTPCTACCTACCAALKPVPSCRPSAQFSSTSRATNYACLHQRARSACLTQTEKAKPRSLQTCFQIGAQLHWTLLPWCCAAC